MELILFFLKVWSIIWTLILIGFHYAFFVKSFSDMKEGKSSTYKMKLDIKTCFEWCLYITSIYSWWL